MHRFRISRTGTVFACSICLGGCAAGLGASSRVTIASEPAGASIFANGVARGVTPQSVVRDEVFPPHWKGTEYRVDGVLTLRKAGCEPYTTSVNDVVLSKDVMVHLRCPAESAPGVEPAAAAPPGSPASGPSDEAAARLRNLDALHKQGLVTDEEYRRIRQRILDGP